MQQCCLYKSHTKGRAPSSYEVILNTTSNQVSFFLERATRCTPNTDVALFGSCQNRGPAVIEYEPINPTKGNYLTSAREVPLRLPFFPDESGTPIPESKLVKDLGVQTDNMFFPSAQCTEAANKA